MDIYSDNSHSNETKETINKFLNIFSDIISFDLKLKLEIVKFYLSGFSTPQIKEILEKMAGKNTPGSEQEKILSLYLKPDCNKLYRIRNYSTSEGLIKIIQLKTLCTYIVQRYPSPDFVGFPYDNWTPYRLKKYICFLFGINGKHVNKKTISNILSDIYTYKENKPTENPLDDSEAIHYYLYIKLDKLNKDEYQGERKYNRHIFATLFQLSDTDCIYTGKCMHRLYFYKNSKTLYQPPTLYDILDQLLKNEKNPKPVIYIEKSSLKTFKNRSFHALKTLPDYRFIIFDFDYIKSIKNVKKLSDKSLNNDIEVLKKLGQLKKEVNKISFSYPYYKNTFLKNITKKITDFCGDY